MTRTYAAKRLLEHGPLTMRELVEITGWPYVTVASTVKALRRTGVVVSGYIGSNRCVFRLPA